MYAFLTVVILVLGTLISFSIAKYTWELDSLGSRLFSFFSISSCFWLATSSLELFFEPSFIDTVLIQLHFVGLILTTTFIFIFSLRYGLGYSMTKYSLIAILIVPSISLIMIFLNPFFGLFWTDVTPVVQGSLNFSKLNRGPFFILHMIYSYLLVVASASIFIRLIFHRRRVFNKQSFAISIALVIPLVFNVLYTLDYLPLFLFDPTPLTVTATQVLFVFALYHTDFHSVTPGIQNIGWDYVSNTIDSGICIVNNNGAIVEYNSWFEQEFAESYMLGDNISEIFTEFNSDFNSDFSDLIIQRNGDYYKIIREDLNDNDAEQVGLVYTVQNITAEIESQQQIRLLNRFLRHNLRNSLSVVMLGIERLKTVEAASKEGNKIIDENVEKVHNQTDKLISMSEAAKDIEKAIEISDVRETQVQDIVETAVEKITGKYNLSDSTEIIVTVGEQMVEVTPNFEIALEQLIENSIEHSESEDLCITIDSKETDEGTVIIQIADNGIGIPQEDIDSFNSELNSKRENQLYHGTGLGFGIAHWLAVQSQGEFRINSNSDGASVEFELRQVKSE